jgi:hypothetical protein
MLLTHGVSILAVYVSFEFAIFWRSSLAMTTIDHVLDDGDSWRNVVSFLWIISLLNGIL